ncbi:MAG TPA: hypothetical protein VE991_09110, partial [Acidimicrobiales bacterium]|nr:hypothetical protein [Acidimicrobiales bacterium]
DEHTASINQGWPYPFVTFSGGQWGRSFLLPTPPGQLAANEVRDPVEEDYYWSDGVAISDWVTPNYFNDHQTVSGGGTYDYMGLVQQPLEIRPGGYQAIYVIDYITPAGETYTGWISLTNFRRQDPAQRGFLDDTGGKAINVDDELSRARR